MSIPEIDEADRFVALVGQPSLLAYYDLNEQSTPEEIEQAVSRRRSWAQGQQANPKFKAEALSLIRHHRAFKAVLTEHFETYCQLVRARQRGTDTYDVGKQVARAVRDGTLHFEDETRILHEAAEAGYNEGQARQLLLEALDSLGVARELPREERSDIVGIDLYGLLQVAPEATESEIEAAYLSRYRWARNLADIKRSAEVLQQLDLAWRTLRSPERRARYDQSRQPPPVPVEDEALSAALATHRLATLPPMAESDSGQHVVLRPPPPDGISSRTVGLSGAPQPIRTTPQLVVDGPMLVTLNIANRPYTHALKVSNPGGRRMPGRVTCNERWVELPRPVLDAQAKEQVIPVLIRPARMPTAQAEAIVRIITDHGQRAEIRFVVHRRSSVVPGVVVVGLAGIAIGAAWMIARNNQPEVPPSLALEVVPYAGQVLLVGADGQERLLGKGALVEAPRDPSAPMVLRVDTPGFLSETLHINPEAGQRITRRVELQPDSPMTWEPGNNARRGTLSPERVREAIERNADALGACFGSSEAAAAEPEAGYRVWVSSKGLIERVDVYDANFDVAPVQPCINRVFRGINLGSLGDGVDYAVGSTSNKIILTPKAPSKGTTKSP